MYSTFNIGCHFTIVEVVFIIKKGLKLTQLFCCLFIRCFSFVHSFIFFYKFVCSFIFGFIDSIDWNHQSIHPSVRPSIHLFVLSNEQCELIMPLCTVDCILWLTSRLGSLWNSLKSIKQTSNKFSHDELLNDFLVHSVMLSTLMSAYIFRSFKT